jgi:hypothetical protein
MYSATAVQHQGIPPRIQTASTRTSRSEAREPRSSVQRERAHNVGNNISRNDGRELFRCMGFHDVDIILEFGRYYLQLFGIGSQSKIMDLKMDAAVNPPMPRPSEIEECFAMLERYSFLQWKRDQQSYAMHKIVHAWRFERLLRHTRQDQRRRIRTACESNQQCGNAPEDKLRLVPHVMANFSTLASRNSVSTQEDKTTLDKLERVCVPSRYWAVFRRAFDFKVRI